MENSARNVISIIDRDHYNGSKGAERSNGRELPSLVIDAEFYEVSKRTVTLASIAKDFAYGIMMASGGLVIICAIIVLGQIITQ